MRYEGRTCQIEAVEKEIQKSAICFLRGKLKPYDELFGVTIPVRTKVFEVLPKKEAKLILVRFFYDDRDGTATMDVNDKGDQWLRRLSLNMSKLLEPLCIQRQQ